MRVALFILLLFLTGCSVSEKACKKEDKKCCVKHL
jgi:hypothetical protein